MGMATTSAAMATTAAANTVIATNGNGSTLGQEEAMLILATICVAVIAGISYTLYQRVKHKVRSSGSTLFNLLFASAIAWVIVWALLILVLLVLTAFGF